MDINEVAKLLQMKREDVIVAIKVGIELPTSKRVIRLDAIPLGDLFDVDEPSLDQFIALFDAEDPGRHPPTNVRRQLLVEANHRCAICREITPIEYHHVIEFHKIKHYDIRHMLAICPTCHTMCGLGAIDQKAQYEYKNRLNSSRNGKEPISFGSSVGPANFSWDELREIITVLHDSAIKHQPDGNSRYDFSNIDPLRKNVLNLMSDNYFETVVLQEHEPYFNRILSFLRNPVNLDIAALYYEIIDELRSKIAANRNDFERFEYFLLTFADLAVRNGTSGSKINRRALNILLSFMYVNCDIGKK